MRSYSWEDSALRLRRSHLKSLPVSLSVLVFERLLKQNIFEIGEYRLTKVSLMSIHSWKAFVLDRKDGKAGSYMTNADVGLAISTILSFAMRCLVISSPEMFMGISKKEDKILFSGMEQLWIETFDMLQSLNEHNFRMFHSHSLDEENEMISFANKIFDGLMGLGEKKYIKIMRILRLYQLALYVLGEDQSLSYALLVATVEACASLVSPKNKVTIDENFLETFEEVLREGNVDENQIDYLKTQLLRSQSLKNRFVEFISKYLPGSFWEGDHSLQSEMLKESEYYDSGQYMIDQSKLQENDSSKEFYLEWASEDVKDYEARKERRRKIEQLESEFEVPFWKQQEEEQRRWVLNYVHNNLAFILSNTYNFRSKLFHSGENFPEIVHKEDYSDWLPKIFDIPSMDYLEEHGGHSFEYIIEGKKIFLKCSCSKKFEKPIIFNLRVFELIVHNAIQNFLTKTLYPGI